METELTTILHLDVRTKPNGKVGEPDDTSGVAGEPNEFGLIKVFRNVSKEKINLSVSSWETKKNFVPLLAS